MTGKLKKDTFFLLAQRIFFMCSKSLHWTMLTAAAIVLSILGCSVAEAKNYTFAVVPKSTSNPFFQDVKSGCEEKADLLTTTDTFVQCLFTGPVDQDADAQAAIMHNLIDDGVVDGIALSVIDEASGTDIIQRAVSAGLPIITFDSDAPKSQRKAYIGTDNVALGKELAWMLQSRFSTSGPGTYAILSDTNPNLILRELGIRETLGDGWEEVDGSPTNFGTNATLGVEQAHDMMKKYSDLTALFSAAGRPMRSPDDAWAEFAARYPDVIFLSADNLPKQMELLNRGFANGLAGQQPSDMGAKAIETLLKLTQEGEGSDVEEFVPTDMQVIARVSSTTAFNTVEAESSSAEGFFSPGATASLILMVSWLRSLCM